MSRSVFGLSVALTALLGAILLAFSVGRFPVSPADLAAVLWGLFSGAEHGRPAAVATVILSVRGPRVLAAVAVGAALASAGAAYQALFRNPLVSPDILGVSTGASVGAALGILLGRDLAVIQLLAFLGGLVAVGCVVGAASLFRGHDPILLLVLAGIAVGALFGAVVSLIKVVADPYNQLPAITFWLLGSLSGTVARDLAGTAPVILAGLVPLALLSFRIDVVSLGEEEARALGVEAGRVRLIVILCATVITASAVSLSGTIGWVGLVVPHMARFLVGPGFARLLPASALLGGGFLLLVDTLARTAARIEIPLGVLTAFVGTPVFVWVLARARRSWS
ncbi:FecCD family ABC transporter permease [Elioraea thermophila]|uniref:FecCD family ABC transporter permease n=1 Tax=Elioraea thermophila TaxID=2185104 RepID=UPI000DF15032|nr:iron ABC transporter permease [Elioraea thermophila]